MLTDSVACSAREFEPPPERALELGLQMVGSYYLALRDGERFCWTQHVCAPYLDKPDAAWFDAGLPVVGYFHDYELALEGVPWMSRWLDQWQAAGARKLIDFRELAAAIGRRLHLEEDDGALHLTVTSEAAPALVSGETHGVTSDANGDLHAPHLEDLLEAHGKRWKISLEDYPGHCFTGAASGTYARKHHPFISFLYVQQDAARCPTQASHDSLPTMIDEAFGLGHLGHEDARAAQITGIWTGHAFGQELQGRPAAARPARGLRHTYGSCASWSQSATAERSTPHGPLPLDDLGQGLLEHLWPHAMAFQALHQRCHWVLLKPF